MNNDYNRWQKLPEYAEELEAIRGNSAEIDKRFAQSLTFGTAGLRGILGAGTARINKHTIGGATESFAHMLLKEHESGSVCIGYDSRHQSRELAMHTACVFAANGIVAHIFDRMVPTPTLSYGVRSLGCIGGVMVTASHNPKEYNGYKVYGEDGGQLVPQIADSIAEHMQSTDLLNDVSALSFDEGIARGMIQYVPESLIDTYIDTVCALTMEESTAQNASLKVVYTPLNGAGLEAVTRTLAKRGFEDINVVEAQRDPDGDFPTCPYPNPEAPEAMSLCIALCNEIGGDIAVATDPDSDRIGVYAGGRLLSGNEIGILMLDYVCRRRTERGTMPKDPIATRSIVSADLADKVAAQYGVQVQTVLTGFKYVGEVITALEEKGQQDRFIMGYEESHGYLSGTHVRDKDGVNATMLICELAATLKAEGQSLVDRMEQLYQTYGYCMAVVHSYAFTGAQPMEDMQAVMNTLRKTPLTEICGAASSYSDFLVGIEYIGEEQREIGQCVSDILKYTLGVVGWVMVRPSGTEPKMKLYLNINAQSKEAAERFAAMVKGNFDRIISC